MENYDSIFAPKENTQDKSFTPFDKQAWVEKKQAERKEVYTLIDNTAAEIAQDSKLFQSCLDVMARFDRYSIGNVLLITAQKPEATKLADFDTWKQSRCYVRKGEDHIKILEPGEEFQREDGSFGVNYNVKQVFDINQTTSRNRPAEVHQDMRMLLKSMTVNAPCALQVSENVPGGVNAFYNADDRKIYLRQGMDGPDIFRCLAQELTFAHLDKEGTYNRNQHAFTAYCSAYTLCKRYGVDTQNFNFQAIPEVIGKMDSQTIREELGKIRECANQISMDMNRFLERRQKERKENSR